MNNICFIENIALKQIPIKTQTRHIYSSINLENSSIKNSGKLDIAAIIIQGCTFIKEGPARHRHHLTASSFTHP